MALIKEKTEKARNMIELKLAYAVRKVRTHSSTNVHT